MKVIDSVIYLGLLFLARIYENYKIDSIQIDLSKFKIALKYDTKRPSHKSLIKIQSRCGQVRKFSKVETRSFVLVWLIAFPMVGGGGRVKIWKNLKFFNIKKLFVLTLSKFGVKTLKNFGDCNFFSFPFVSVIVKFHYRKLTPHQYSSS